MSSSVQVDVIKEKIYSIRGKRVMLDMELAQLYEVETGHLNRAVKRNRDRFPHDFMFKLTQYELSNLGCQFGISSWGGTRIMESFPEVQLTKDEFENWKSQFVISNSDKMGSRKRPYAVTEHKRIGIRVREKK